MPWVIGIDEAGYGPNLGPLLQAATAVRVPDVSMCVWQMLATVLGTEMQVKSGDSRLMIDDSKKVHAAVNGTARLERGVLATAQAIGLSLGEFTSRFGLGESHADLLMEEWFHPAEPLPIEVAHDDLSEQSQKFMSACTQAGISFAGLWCMITPTTRFNAILDTETSKGAVLARGVIDLLKITRAAIPGDEPLEYRIDKQGGRHYYAPMIQTAFPDGWVSPIVEKPGISRYRVDAIERPIFLTFEPRADAGHWTVALASMACKYLRETLMRQFNRFWLSHVPGLRPTAGYPNDATRFYQEIGPAMEALGLQAHQVWRRK